jgi:hypothetical protein
MSVSWVCPDRGDISSPLLIRTRCCEIPIQAVRSHTGGWVAWGGDSPMTRPARNEFQLSHQTSRPLACAPDPLGLQFGVDARTALHLSVSLVHRLNAVGKLAIFSLMLTHRTPSPGVIPTDRHVKCLAEQAHRRLLPVVFDESKPYGWLREKMATAFFTISRSCRVLSNSRLSWRSSSSCAVWCPLPGKASGPCSVSSLRP